MRKLLLILFSFSLILDGCNSNGQIKLLTTNKSLPSNFDEIATKRKEKPYFKYLVKKAKINPEYEEEWKNFKISSDIKEVNFSKKDVFFIGFLESSSCPKDLENVEVDNDHLNISLKVADGNCTADESARVIVLEIAKEISKNIETAIIVEGKENTSVPIK